MARDYMATSEALEKEAGTYDPTLADRSDEPPDGTPDQAARGAVPDDSRAIADDGPAQGPSHIDSP